MEVSCLILLSFFNGKFTRPGLFWPVLSPSVFNIYQLSSNDLILEAKTELVKSVSIYVKNYMSNYDASHDYSHILRVVSLAHKLASIQKSITSHKYDSHLITLSALLHDVGDRKYLKLGEDGDTMVYKLLKDLGAAEDLATIVQTICSNVSYSSEIKNPKAVKQMAEKIPELAVVQDADRLDAIGAIGIGRTFTYGGARGGANPKLNENPTFTANALSVPNIGGDGSPIQINVQSRGMGETIDHFTDKLEKIGSMMKTDAGYRIAIERTERLKTFRRWWEDEYTSLYEAQHIRGIVGLD